MFSKISSSPEAVLAISAGVLLTVIVSAIAAVLIFAPVF